MFYIIHSKDNEQNKLFFKAHNFTSSEFLQIL